MQKSSASARQCRFLIVCDVDSTLINEEVIDELAKRLGVGEQVAEITEAAMAGQLDFSESLRRRVALLKGLSLEAFQQVREQLSFTLGAQDLVKAVHHAGGKIFAVSGGFHEILDDLAAELDLDGWLANRLATDNSGILSGEIDGEIVDAAAKRKALIAWAEEYGVPLENTIAVGDGANDRDMVQAAGLGIAFDAKAALREVADLCVPERNLAQLSILFPVDKTENPVELMPHAEAAINWNDGTRDVSGIVRG